MPDPTATSPNDLPDDALAEFLADRAIERLAVLRAAGRLPDHSGPATQEQVADRLGLSRKRVRQIEHRALLKLRHLLQLPTDP